MRSLERAVRKRRRLVFVAWLLVVLAALPFAARQSEHLTTGGFRVEGSGSQAVDQMLREKFPGYDRSPLAAVIAPRPGASRADVAAAQRRVLAAVRARDDVKLATTREPAVSAGQPTLIPLRTGQGDDENIEIALGLRKELGIDDSQSGPVRVHLVGYGGLWSGMNETSKRDLAQAEALGFPIVA